MEQKKIRTKPRQKRTVLKNRLRQANISLPPFSGWSVISIECVLSDVAKSNGYGINKRTLKMLVCIYELYKIKGFAYVGELVVLMGMDYTTVQRLLSEMERMHLLCKLDSKQRVAGIKPAVSDWTVTQNAKDIISDIHYSWSRLTFDLGYGDNVALRRIRNVSYS